MNKKDGGKMKIKKSALSILMILSLIITSLVPSLAFADGVDNSSALVKLGQLGIIDSSTTDLSSTFTREQMVRAIIIAKDLEDEAATLEGSTIFPDVVSNSELSGYVNTVLSRGIMYGMPDGYFHPESAVTYAEACVTMVKLLGYTDSDVTGIWPNNYISKATDLKLNDGIRLRKSDKLTVGTAAVMLNRLLDTNIKKVSANAADMTFSQAINLYNEITVYDTAKTYWSLAENAVLTDKGTLYLEDAGVTLQAGNTYRVHLEDNSIKSVFGSISDSFGLTVDSVVDNTVYYKDNYISKSMILPSDVAYYYHGVKQSYDKLKDILKTNTSLVFAYNDNKTGYKYAVVVDPIYSKPEIAESFDGTSDKLGNIVFDVDTKIIKNGKEISKSQIEDMDVVYSVSDMNGNNRVIYVYNDKAEGDIKEFTPNGPAPTSVKIDNSTYSFSKDMDISIVAKFKQGDKVAALLGYDGKVVAIRKIDYKIGNEIQVRILGNNKTSDNLIDNQVLTEDNKKYYVLEGAGTLEVGGEYKVNVDGDTIVKVKNRLNALYNYSIRRVSENTIFYGGGDNPSSTILPQISTYYYHGAKTDYKTVLDSLKLGSSVVIAVKNGIYDYGIVVDPVYSKPVIMGFQTKEVIDRMNDNSLFIYKGGEYYNLIGFIEDRDVVYSVSDLWDINKYIYVADTQVRGRIKNILPNKVNPKSIQIDNTTYSISKYFDTSKLSKAKVDSYVKVTLDIDGKIINIDVY
jgi:hypothetical protein